MYFYCELILKYFLISNKIDYILSYLYKDNYFNKIISQFDINLDHLTFQFFFLFIQNFKRKF